ncbi:MAG: hypothetical protein ABIO04_02505 [Ferruginibacter sp.]
MKKLTAVMITAILFFYGCGNEQDGDALTDDYEKGKMSVAEMEKKNPIQFLSVSGSDKKNILGQTVINGIMINNAKIASFKDIDIKLSFYSKTGALLEEDHEMIYETLSPGESKSFKSKYFAAKGTDSVGMKVIGAKAIK